MQISNCVSQKKQTYLISFQLVFIVEYMRNDETDDFSVSGQNRINKCGGLYMTLSMLLAWIAAVLLLITVFRYFARISNSEKLNRFFHKLHIPVGVLLIAIGLLHGLLAGNFADTSISDIRLGEVLFSLNWGTLCFILSVLLAVSYAARRILKKNWMNVHRILTIGMLITVVLHVMDVGIQLPARILSGVTDTSYEQEALKDQVNGSISFSGAQLQDGVFEGSAQGFKDEIQVSVTVEKGRVTDIEITKENDTPKYFERAKTVIEEIIDKQSLNVDAVSGATYSSAGILSAVNDALEAAVIDGQLEYEEPSENMQMPDNPEHKNGVHHKKHGKDYI